MWGFNSIRDRLILAGVIVLLAYTNCGKVKFSMDTEGLRNKLNADGGLLINGGAEFTNSQDVTLGLIHGSADEMYITNDETCQSGGAWEPYTPFKPFRLVAANVEGKAFVKYREKSVLGAESACFTDTIVHDDIPPQIAIVSPIAPFINLNNATLGFTVTDSGSGVDSAQCQVDGAGAVSCKDAHTSGGLGEGPHEFLINATDRAGNKAVPVLANFVVDQTPPVVVLNQTPPAVTSDLQADFRFSATDALSGVDRTECKMDNDPAFAACSSPFSQTLIDGTHKFYVRAVDRAGNVSAPVTYEWLIDRTAPSVKITKMPPPYSNQTTASFEFEGTDGGNVALTNFECKIDAGAYTPSCTSPKDYTNLTAGTHTFSVRGKDGAGNLSAPASYVWTIDLTPPVVQITSKPPAVTNQTSATYIFNAQDAGGVAKIECQLNGAAFADCMSPKNYPNLTEGTYTFGVRATDNAGNTSTPVTHTFRVDLTPPVVEITSGPAAQTNVKDARLEFRAYDPNNPDGMKVAKIECYIDGGTYVNCTSPEIYPALTDGPHIFHVRAVDLAGNLSPVKTHNWLLDATPPAINFGKTPVAVIGSSETSTIQFTVTDAGVGVDVVRCGLDGMLSACNTTDERKFSQLAPGDHSFSVEATDKLGNKSVKETKWKVELNTIDQTQNISVTSNNKADVLVVIDNSGSMAPEQANMASRFGTFLDQLKTLDWQVGIITTDVNNDAPKKDGRFLQFANIATPTYILTSQMDLATAKSSFGATIQRPASEGSGNEQGIRATYRAIQRSQDASKTENQPNAAFFRQGAALSVLVVTDADETNPAGTDPMNVPQNLVNLVKTTFANQKPFSYHSIIVKPDDAACKGQANNEGYGYSYDSLSKMTGGIVGTVCAADYGSQLAAMGQGVVDLVNSATLTCQPLDVNGDGKADVTIQTANGSSAPSYTINGTTITFGSALPQGTNKLSYTCLKP